MIEIYCELYLEEGLRERKEKIIKRLRKGRLVPGCYVISLAERKEEYLDIYPATELIQKYYKEKEIFIVGLASSQEGAILMIEQLTSKVYEETKGADLKAYIRNKQGKRMRGE